jgi:hypothetical protein
MRVLMRNLDEVASLVWYDSVQGSIGTRGDCHHPVQKSVETLTVPGIDHHSAVHRGESASCVLLNESRLVIHKGVRMG